MLSHKTIGELYDAIGYYRHGKTILYRDLMNYISITTMTDLSLRPE